MIIINLIGGLGNQMFQYAYARRLALKENTQLKLDTRDLSNDPIHKRNLQLQMFNIQAAVASRVDVITTKFLHLGTYLNGYWQGEKYFFDIKEVIQKEFSFKRPPVGKNITLLNNISRSQSVSIHIRRGDYLDKPDKYAVLDKSYYLRAIAHIRSKVTRPQFYVFAESSADRQWAKSFLELPSVYFISNNPSKRGYEDLRLMIACKHNIIANSTFSWWGAWLNKNSKKIIIAPKQWLMEFPVEWKTI